MYLRHNRITFWAAGNRVEREKYFQKNNSGIAYRDELYTNHPTPTNKLGRASPTLKAGGIPVRILRISINVP